MANKASQMSLPAVPALRKCSVGQLLSFVPVAMHAPISLGSQAAGDRVALALGRLRDVTESHSCTMGATLMLQS